MVTIQDCHNRVDVCLLPLLCRIDPECLSICLPKLIFSILIALIDQRLPGLTLGFGKLIGKP